MEVVRCPNPKCRRRILDDEGTETEWTVLEIKCQHCGKLVRLYCVERQIIVPKDTVIATK